MGRDFFEGYVSFVLVERLQAGLVFFVSIVSGYETTISRWEFGSGMAAGIVHVFDKCFIPD
jgi:hypothetical protein